MILRLLIILFMSSVVFSGIGCGESQDIGPIQGTTPNWRNQEKVKITNSDTIQENFIEFRGAQSYEFQLRLIELKDKTNYNLSNISSASDDCVEAPIVEINLVGIDSDNRIVKKQLLLENEDFLFNGFEGLTTAIQVLAYRDRTCGPYGIYFLLNEAGQK